MTKETANIETLASIAAEVSAPVAPPAASSLPAITISLTRPISDDAGMSWTEVTLHEPELGHMLNAERDTTSSVTEAMRLFAEVSGLPEIAIGRLKTKDAMAIRRVVDGFEKHASPVDARIDGDRHTIALDAPIELPGQAPISHITLREPDMAVGVIVEKIHKMRARQAAMIAELSGIKIPVLRHLKARDIARIEAWLGPFVADDESKEEAGETS